MDPQAQLLAFFSLSISLLEILIIGIILKNYEEPLGRNCRETLLTQLTDRFFG